MYDVRVILYNQRTHKRTPIENYRPMAYSNRNCTVIGSAKLDAAYACILNLPISILAHRSRPTLRRGGMFNVHQKTCRISLVTLPRTKLKLEKTALDRGRTDRNSLNHDLDLDFQSPASCGRDLYSHAKGQGQWSVGSEDRVETNGRTDRRTEPNALPRSYANAVGNKPVCW